MRFTILTPACAAALSSFAMAGLAMAMTVATITPARADRDPDDVVEIIYEAYEENETPGVLEDGRLVELHFSARLGDLMARHRGRLQFDPVIDGQNRDVSDVDIEIKGQRGDVVVVEVRFETGGEKKRVGYALVQENGAWRIDDIAADGEGGRWMLSKLLIGEHLTSNGGDFR